MRTLPGFTLHEYTRYMEQRQDYKINRYFFLAIIILFAVFLLYSLAQFFTAFLAAIMFYVLSKSPVEWLIKKKGWSKSLAAVLVIVVSFFIILLPISLLAAMLYKKVVAVSSNAQIILNPLKNLDALLQSRFHFTLLSAKNLEQLQLWLTNFISSVLNQGLNLVSAITMMYFFLYFMIVNINRMEAAIVFYLPFKRDKIKMFGDELKAQTFSNAVGVPLIALVQGCFAYLSFLITGMDEAGFWAVITGFASVIPVVGTGLVWLPAGVYLIATGLTWQGIFILGWGAIVLSSMDNVVRFVLAKRMADVHPVVTVLGVIVGLNYFGITGLIFGPLLISYFIILLKIYYLEFQQPSVQKRKRVVAPEMFSLPFMKRSSNKK